MQATVHSFAKINLGLGIGALRPDGFHDLRTIYQTIALHDVIRVEVRRGTGIEIRCEDARVPKDGSNTCHRMAERVMTALKAKGRVVIELEKRLPVQGGLGGASGNAVATLLALERVLKKQVPGAEKLRIAAEIGSDLPLFLIGGTVLGLGRGEEVYPLPDLPSVPCVVATPGIGVSTPQAFADWDAIPQGLKPGQFEVAGGTAEAVPSRMPLERNASRTGGHDFNRAADAATQFEVLAPETDPHKLTPSAPSDRMNEFSRTLCAWLGGPVLSGVSARKRGGRAETLLLDLVRTGIENDFEQVVFPKYPELREVKSVLERAGAQYASLSGSGSAIYGVFPTRLAAERAAARLRKSGTPAAVTTTLTRGQYWARIFDC